MLLSVLWSSRIYVIQLTPVLVSASYEYCCEGMYCPDCPLTLEFHVLDKTHLVTSALKLTCSEHVFEKDIEVIAQPGIHTMEVTIILLAIDITLQMLLH